MFPYIPHHKPGLVRKSNKTPLGRKSHRTFALFFETGGFLTKTRGVSQFLVMVLQCVFVHTCDPTVESNRLAQSKESREKEKKNFFKKGKKLGTVRLRRYLFPAKNTIISSEVGVFRPENDPCSRVWVHIL